MSCEDVGVPGIARLGVWGFMLPVVFKLAPKSKMSHYLWLFSTHLIPENRQIRANASLWVLSLCSCCTAAWGTIYNNAVVIKQGRSIFDSVLFSSTRVIYCWLGDSLYHYLKTTDVWPDAQCGQCKWEMQKNKNPPCFQRTGSLWGLQDKPANVSAEVRSSSA